MAQPYYYQHQYAQLPVFQWRTYDLNTLTFSAHPIIPPERIYPSYSYADDRFKTNDLPPPIIDDQPHDPPAGEPFPDDMEGKSLPIYYYTLTLTILIEIILLDDKHIDEEANVPPPEEKAGEDPPSPEATEASEDKGMCILQLCMLYKANMRG